MSLITLEEHILTPAFAAATAHLRARQPPVVRQQIEYALLDLGPERIRAMDAVGVDMQVLSLAAEGLNDLPPQEARFLAADANERIAGAMQSHPERFAGFATAALAHVESAVEEIHRSVEQLGFHGVMLHGTVNGVFLDDAQFEPVWRAIESLGVPAYIHPALPPVPVEHAFYAQPLASSGWQSEAALHILRLIVSGLFDRHPKLRLIIGGLGADLPSSIARMAALFQYMAQHLKRPFEHYFRKHFWITTGGNLKKPLFDSALASVGIDRMLLSMNYPYGSVHLGRRFFNSLRLSQEDRMKLGCSNAAGLLRVRLAGCAGALN